MTTRLQSTDHAESRYERPNQRWVCGWAASGRPCVIGPDRDGRCTAHAEAVCAPVKRGDRWYCTRPKEFGGPCGQGPLPDGACSRPAPEHAICQPVLSLRARRRRLALATVLFTFGLLLALVEGPWRLRFLSPGDVSAAHMAIQGGGEDADGCHACHGTARQATLGWLLSDRDDDVAGGDSERCLSCHFADRPAAPHARDVHSVAPARLAAVTEAAVAASADVAAAGAAPSLLACATCHKEHRGRGHDLRQLDDDRCQVCHVRRFASFAEHPEFRPIARLHRGIRFDHVSHRQRDHFGDQEFACQRCHQADLAGRTMTLRPFETACAGCHNQGRDDHHGARLASAGNAVMVVQLPEMLVADDTYWPADAALGDEELPPLLRLLLAGDERAGAALRSLRDDADWFAVDWEPDDAQLADELAAAMLRLVSELVDADEDALDERLQRALDAVPGAAAVAALNRQLRAASSSWLAYRNGWLPGLSRDRGGGEEDGEEPVPPDWSLAPDAAGWSLDPDLAEISYRPVAHADGFLKALAESLAGHAGVDVPAPDDSEAAFRAELRSELFDELLGRDGPIYRACLRCHTVDRSDRGYRVNWAGAGRELEARGYARFNHRPHMAMLHGEDSCVRCHRLADERPAGAAEPADDSPGRGFQAHDKANCGTCHTTGGANATCLNCHIYHFQRPQTRMPEAIARAVPSEAPDTAATAALQLTTDSQLDP